MNIKQYNVYHTTKNFSTHTTRHISSNLNNGLLSKLFSTLVKYDANINNEIMNKHSHTNKNKNKI